MCAAALVMASYKLGFQREGITELNSLPFPLINICTIPSLAVGCFLPHSQLNAVSKTYQSKTNLRGKRIKKDGLKKKKAAISQESLTCTEFRLTCIYPCH